jgi:hypothetical protein
MFKRLSVSVPLALALVFGASASEIPIVGKAITAEAAVPSVWKTGSYYWDNSAGRYVVTSYPVVKGSQLLSPGINELLNLQAKAVKSKYGSIKSGTYYKFTVVQWVSQANITSMKGSIRSVVCNGIY